jgi:predicted nucleotidyltransferase
MIQEEFRDLVFKFAKYASVEGVEYIFLFGSVAKGDADRRSDVDILTVLDTYNKDFEEMEAKTRISELALTLEKEFDRNIQIVFTNKNYKGIDGHLIEEVLKEGILIFAKSPSIVVQGFELDHYILITFSLEKLSAKDKMRVKRLLYGFKTKKFIKGVTYRYEDAGLVQKLDGLRIGSGAIAVPKKNISDIEKELNNLKLKFKTIDLWMTKDSIRKLQSQG